MRLHCLGTVGYHPNDSSHTSCYFLPQSGILLDAGTGIFRLAKLIETDSLDVLLSHAHLDHSFGLTFLLDVLFEGRVYVNIHTALHPGGEASIQRTHEGESTDSGDRRGDQQRDPDRHADLPGFRGPPAGAPGPGPPSGESPDG